MFIRDLSPSSLNNMLEILGKSGLGNGGQVMITHVLFSRFSSQPQNCCVNETKEYSKFLNNLKYNSIGINTVKNNSKTEICL